MPKPDGRSFRKRFQSANRGRGTLAPQLPGNTPRTQGNVSRQQGNTSRSQGNAFRPQGNASRPQGNASRGRGNASRSRGNNVRLRGKATRPQGNATRPQGNATRPVGKRTRSRRKSADQQGSGWNENSMLSNMLDDLPPEVRKEFQQYPPVVQLLARIAIGGSSSVNTNEAIRLLGIQGLPEDHRELADKFHPLISKLVESASAPALQNGPGPPAMENLQNSHAAQSHPGPSRLDYGDGSFQMESYNPAVLPGTQNSQDYNFSKDNSAVGMMNYMSAYTQQLTFSGTGNTGVPDGAGGSFMGNVHPSASNMLTSGVNISFTVPPPVIIQNSSCPPSVPSFYPTSDIEVANCVPPAVEPPQAYQLPEQPADPYDPTSPTSSQHQGSDMSEQDMLPSSPLDERQSPSRFDDGDRKRTRPEKDQGKELSDEDKLYREFFNFMSTKGRADIANPADGLSTDDRARDQQTAGKSPDHSRRLQGYDSSLQEYNRVPSDRNRGSLDHRQTSPDHNSMFGQRSPNSRLPDRRSLDCGQRLPDHGRRLQENQLSENSRRSSNHSSSSPDRTRSSDTSRKSQDRNQRLADRCRKSPDSHRQSNSSRRSPGTICRSPSQRSRSTDRSRRSPNQRSRSTDRNRKSPNRSRSPLDNYRRSQDRNRGSPDRYQRLPDRSRMPSNRKLPDHSGKSYERRKSPNRGVRQDRKSPNPRLVDHGQISPGPSHRSIDHSRQPVDRSRQSVDRSRQLVDRSRQSVDRSRQSVDRTLRPTELSEKSSEPPCRISVIEAISGRRLTRTEGEMIELALLKRITAKDEIKCLGVYREAGAVVFVCSDEKSARWIVRTVPFLLPWAGASLKAEPWSKQVNSLELLFELPSILTHLPWAGLCEKIQQQNGRLATSEWRLIVDEDTTRVCTVDKKSLNILKKQNFKAFVGFFQIEFKLISEGKR